MVLGVQGAYSPASGVVGQSSLVVLNDLPEFVQCHGLGSSYN